MKHKLYLIRISTTQEGLLPYSHCADQGHDPCLTVFCDAGKLYLKCEDIFKLKPNVQKVPRDRIDIYIPYSVAGSLGTEISECVGIGRLAKDAETDPEQYRKGRKELPRINNSKAVRYDAANVQIAGYTLSQHSRWVYIELVRPIAGYSEMKEPEVHLGFDLNECAITGRKDGSLIQSVSVPASELRMPGERNPVEKAKGEVLLSFDLEDAKNLGSTLLFLDAKL